ncbi:MAG: hypothetical protein N3A66_06620 [Planctomycetota bacterium]|nr:hypothetical protein [Planctomycetota bacterium]
MAITGEKFLALNNAAEMIISEHALARMAEGRGEAVDETRALREFLSARQVRSKEIFLLGYRPNYHGRLKQGMKSWYFRLEANSIEQIAVIGQREPDGKIVWLTTYTRNAQTDHYQALSYAELAIA